MSRYDLTDFEWRGIVGPIRLDLTAGQTNAGQIADTLLDHLGSQSIVLADKVYEAGCVRELIQDQGATPNIPPQSNRRWKPCFSKRLSTSSVT